MNNMVYQWLNINCIIQIYWEMIISLNIIKTNFDFDVVKPKIHKKKDKQIYSKGMNIYICSYK